MGKGTILYIGFFGLPDKDAAACRVMNNAKILQDLGYDVVFIDEQTEYPYDNILASKRKINSFTVYSLKRPQNSREYLNKMIGISSIKAVTKELDNLKMIIAYNYPSIALERLRRSFKNKIKICSDCTEWYSGKEYAFPLRLFSKMDSFYRMRIIQKKLDGIICISSFLQNYYKDKTITAKIPPLIDIKDEIWHQEKLDFDLNKVNLVYAGTPGRYKDLIMPIVNAVNNSQHRDSMVLRIVGMTKEQYLEQNPGKVDNFGDNIIFMGRLSHIDTIKIVGSSDYMIFIREKNRVSMAGFSTKFVEAVTSNTAVITTDTSDMYQYIEKAGKGIILKDIADLNEVFSNIDELKFGQKKDRQLVPCNIFDYRSYIEQMKEFLEDIC